MEKLAARISMTLKTLGAVQLISGCGGFSAVLIFAGPQLVAAVGEDLMMDGQTFKTASLICLSFVIAAGAISLFKVPWGWIFGFTAAVVVLVMSLLMGPGTLPITKWSFLGLMILSLVNWSAAIVHYYYDLYT